MRRKERAQSIALTHALTVAITAVLIGGLLLSTGTFLQNQQSRVATQQLRDVGGDVAALIEQVDGLNATGERVEVSVEPTHPRTITGETYRMQLRPESGRTDTTATLFLRMSQPDVSVAVSISTDTPMAESAVRGASPMIRLCPGTRGGRQQVITLGRCP